MQYNPWLGRLIGAGDGQIDELRSRIGASLEELVEALADAQVEVLVDVVATGEQVASVSDILEVSLGAGKCGIEQGSCVSCGGGGKGVSFRILWLAKRIRTWC